MLETIFSLVLCGISIFIFYSSTQFDMSFIGTSGLGPEFFPKVLAVVLFVLSAMMCYGSIKNKNKKSIYNENMKYTFTTMGIFAVYIFCIKFLGYLTSTILFAFVVITLLKSKSMVLRVVFAVLFPTVLYLLFTYVFKVSLPTGLFI